MLELALSLASWAVRNAAAALFNRRIARLTVHHAYHAGSAVPCFFVNVTNLSRTRDIEITHVWFASRNPVNILEPERPLPRRLRPDESWETWVAASAVPTRFPRDVYTLARARLSTGKILRSRRNRDVPTRGAIPGG